MTDIYVHNDSNVDSSLFNKLSLLNVIILLQNDLYTH